LLWLAARSGGDADGKNDTMNTHKDEIQTTIIDPIPALELGRGAVLGTAGKTQPEAIYTPAMPPSTEAVGSAAAQVRRKLGYWWDDSPEERYWVETSQWKQFGKDLSCPQGKDGGHRLICAVHPGDIIIHYSVPAQAYVGASIAEAEYTEKPILWNDYIRRFESPYTLTFGWTLPLHHYKRFDKPVPLSYIQTATIERLVLEWRVKMKAEIGRRRKQGAKNIKTATFDSFLPSRGKIYAANNYLSKLPTALLGHLPRLEALVRSLGTDNNDKP
jgi:hypothetical protein